MSLKNKVVLITGAGRGAGRALALACAERGMKVAVNDISPVNVDEVVAEIRARGGVSKTYVEDVVKKISAQALIQSVFEDFGGLDALLYHAAVNPSAPLLAMDEWDWHRALDVNLTGAFLTMQSAARVMMEKSAGRIVLLLAAETFPQEKSAAYLAGKAGLARLAESAAAEFSPLGIRVRAVPLSSHAVIDTLSILEAE